MKFNTGFCTYDDVTLVMNMYQEKSGWRSVLQWGSGSAGWQQANCEPLVCQGSQEGKLHTGQTQHSQMVKKGDDSAVFWCGLNPVCRAGLHSL